MKNRIDEFDTIIPNVHVEDGFIDMSGNLNFNYPTNNYPDPIYENIKDLYSGYIYINENIKINRSNIILTRGGVDGLDLCLKLMKLSGYESIGLMDTTFVAFEYFSNLYDFKIIKHPFVDSNLSALGNISNKSDVLLLCNPNNPTGTSISEDDIYQITSAHRGPIIIDEAYIDFSNNKSSLNFLYRNENVIILRTFSKAWGRPDLRLGSVISSKKWIDRLVKMQPPFQVSKYAILEFEEMLENQDAIRCKIDKVVKERDKLVLMLSDLSQLKIYKSDANFIYCKCKNYAELKDHLINSKIQVKCFDKMYPETMRITVSNNENNNLLAQALHKFYN